MKLVIVALLVSAMLLAISQSSASNGSGLRGFSSLQFHLGADTYAELRKAPEKAVSRTNPLENDPEAVAAGKLLFADHCAECHGDDAKGGRKAPSLRVSEVQNATPGTLFWLLTNGVVRKKMPAWSKLPEPQRWQLVRFLKSPEIVLAAPADNATKP
jgi:mono/diheme cytochrome c family protein